LNASNSETDRGRALVATSLIEEMLEEVLRGFFLDNTGTKKLFDDPNAPLSTLSAKASACRALGLISSEEFRDIELVRKIRNAFAHSVTCSFDDDKIRNFAGALKIGMSSLDALEKGHKSRVDDPKGRFVMVTVSLVSSLYNRAHYVKKVRLTERTWPL
jgi:DNA-binding MltR family transcriptional regulator